MSYFKPRNLLLLLALLLALGLAVTIARNFRPEKRLETLAKSLPEGVNLALQDIDYTHIENGKPRWKLVARQVEHQAAAGILGISDPRLTFFAEQDGQEEGTLVAASGEVSSDYQMVKLRGDVVLTSSAGYTLRTQQLDYDLATQTATSDTDVAIEKAGMELRGRGLVFKLKQQQLTLVSHVRGVFAEGRK